MLLFFFLVLFLFIIPLSVIIMENFRTTTYNNAHFVLTVKDNEDTVEGEVRSLSRQIINHPGLAKELVIIDLGSSDQTPLILEKLSCEYDFVRTMAKDEYIDRISNS